ncbi:MAG: quinoprotein relay system zinc metallohydrolase 1 [Rhodocyclaceae bacterium]|nr:quinoprotein relay system zinc metallohydrolase 1 [Rhodocyclaceae bacterium]
MKRLIFSCLLGSFCTLLAAESNFDYGLQAQRVADDVYVFIGRNEDFSTVNGGNIVNTGFIVTAAGLVVIDSGPSLRYGQQMQQAMKKLSSATLLQVINTHHHPDHFLGNQAFAGTPIVALEATRQGIASEGNVFAENLYRLSGDWMKGTESVPPTATIVPGRVPLGGRTLRLLALDGHTDGDLAIYDETSGVLFAGDLVFNNRAPTTPHARIKRWLASLDTLEAITREPGFTAIVPGHGAIARDGAPIRQTRAWLRWLDQAMREAAAAGFDLNEVMARPLPAEFAEMAVGVREYQRSVGHLFPAAEQEALGHAH